jgi:carbamoyltransferase
VNTSFNGFHEPMVCSPRDAVRVFYGTGLDVMLIENFLLKK